MFNQMFLTDMILFIVCTSKTTIKSLDKFTVGVFSCVSVCRCQSPGVTGCRALSPFYLLGKVHIPKVPGSRRALFSHAPYFIIIDDL